MIEGVDVSVWQGSVNWALVKNSGRRFGYAKASEGTTLVDVRFHDNWTGMQAAGLFRGAYHYAHPGRDAATQAVHFHAIVGDLAPGDLPPALDLEEDDGQKSEVVLNWTEAFLAKAEELFARTLVVYTGGFWKYALGNPSTSPISTRALWLAQYSMQPTLPHGWTSWTFHQYSGSGVVPGVQGACDLDRFAGDESALRALARLPVVEPPPVVPKWTRYFVWPSKPPISGPDVASWQAKARALGFQLDVDGVYGPVSKSACMALQKSFGLNVDGIVGPKTWAATFAP